MKESFTDHLRLNSGQRRQLLGRLDRGVQQDPDRCKRQYPRLEYRAMDIAVSVMHPGGSRSRLLVCSRNLSAGGIGFIHGGYLHPGTECSMVLMRRNGTPLALVGTVRHCRHLQGNIHEIGIQFANEIDPTTIMMPEDLTDSVLHNSPGDSVQVPTLRGLLLLIEDSPVDRKLFRLQIGGTGLDIATAETSGAALDAVKRQSFDAVVSALNLADGTGIYVVRRMREIGFRGPILALTAEMSPPLLAEVRAAGASELVGKPYEPVYVMQLLSDWLDQPAAQHAIVSRLENDPAMRDLLIEFVGETQRLARRLAVAVDEHDAAIVRELCLKMFGSGTHHGFEQLSVGARDALWNLDAAGGEVADALGPLRRLIRMCSRLHGGDDAH